MSFDIFLYCFRKREEAPIPRKMFDAIFGPRDTHPQLRAKDPGYMTVEYPNGSGAAIYCGGYKNGKDATGMMFNSLRWPVLLDRSLRTGRPQQVDHFLAIREVDLCVHRRIGAERCAGRYVRQ
ncbi:MAG TPA: hypothetical protein VGF92_12245 [Stellaceae bacterium]|jgi:hypothetical protein